MATLYKRGRVWWCRAQRKGREFRRSLKTSDRATAERRQREWLDDLDRQAWGDRPHRTFIEAAEKFASEHARSLKPSSARRYAVSLKHLLDHFGGMMLHQVGSATLSDFETKRRTDGVSVPTIRRDLACLSSLMSSAEDWEWIDHNPIPLYMRRRRKRGFKEAPPRQRYLSHIEETALLSHATPAVRQAIIFALDTGLRREEQFGLRWDQLDLARGRIRLDRNTKSGVPREIPLFGRAARLPAQLPRHIRSPYLFWHEDGRRYMNMEKGLKAAARRAGIKDLRWHDLRRTFGCRRLQDDGLSMEQVKELLGHHSVTVTERSYAFLSMDDIANSLTKTGSGIAD